MTLFGYSADTTSMVASILGRGSKSTGYLYIYIETELEKLYKSQPWGLSLWLYPSTTPSAVSESSSIPKKQQRTHSPCHCASQVILGTPVAQAVANIQKNEWPNIR